MTPLRLDLTDEPARRYYFWVSLEHREAYAASERRKVECLVAEYARTGGGYYPDYPAEAEREARHHPAMH